ncbi:TonB-dependent receptor [Flavicella sediminum]|uniref:TonB-dependent receptor n=1 Tax=Flavicella sediminum TaxID=2585141 RepID=UPI00112163B2|nr:TonB-dependent receptor [Flavicella sediminum]
MKRKYSSLLLFLLFSNFLVAQEMFTLSGIVSEESSDETLIGVNIILPDLVKGTTTNGYGFYSITLPKGTYKIEVSYLGYKTIAQEINLTNDTKQNFSLALQSEQIDEVIVKSNSTIINLRKPEMSVHKVSVTTIKEMPVVLGEVDIIKSIQLLPGVTSAGEGASGFNVRGGAEDQNLILLDEATLYSSSHFFGFFSIFNADAIKNIKLYKGGIPAKFGGRVSSVLDIHQKDGNKQEHHFSGGIGLISSRLMAEGPLAKGKSSYLVAGRTSYVNVFLKANPDTKDNGLSFYDLNAKLNFDLNDDNKLYFSGYFGRDSFNIGNLFVNSYGNSTFNVRWNHLFSDQLFSNLSLIYSEYNYFLNLDFIGMDWDSGIRNFHLKYDFKNYISDDFKLNYGLSAINYNFNPGEISPSKENSAVNPGKLEQKRAIEPALYIEAEHNLTDKISVNYGLRASSFFRMGGQQLYTYENDQPITYNSETNNYEEGVIKDSISYGKSESIKNFWGLEPRLAISYKADENNAFKANYNRTYQYIHLISNTVSAAPLDVWAPSGKFIKPQIGDQIALGYYRNFKDEMYSFETEVYYKEVQNRLDYRDGADLIAQEQIETIVLPGKSRSYGLELSLKKNIGNLKGWISYTLSRAEMQVNGDPIANSPGINNGEWYKANYDKTHDLSITASYTLSDKWRFGTNFIYQTGRPATYPNGQFTTNVGGNYDDANENIYVPIYGNRNEENLPAYHHLDIAATYTPKQKKERRWKGEWVFSIYNIYNRKNAASINFRQNEETGANEAARTSIFGLVPSFTYNFKF